MSSSALAAGLRHLRRRMAAQDRTEDSDEQLLHAFAADHDESAFDALVRRHGPMVLNVCRRVLGHQQDAEDAFQAVFLVLARNAAGLRKQTAVAGFLHGTAYRIALHAKRSAARRRKHEDRTPTRTSANPSDKLSWREVRAQLDEEIGRLPEIYRSAFVLCCLEDLSQPEAARRLGVKEGTLSNRLAEARKRLRARLAHRGMDLTAAIAAAVLTAESASALPPALFSSTMRAALGEASAASISAPVAELVRGTVSGASLSKPKLATAVLLTISVLAGAGWWGVADIKRLEQASPAGSPRSLAAPQKKINGASVKGRVLLPDGKPAENATILLRQMKPDATGIRFIVLTTTGPDGRFRVEQGNGAEILATKLGFALDWAEVHFKSDDLTLTLAERATVR